MDGKSLIIARKFSVDGESTRVRDKSQRNEGTRGDREETREFTSRDTRSDSLESVSQD